MNCQEFQSIVHDWCQPSLDANVRCDGLEHAAACAKCGNLFASVHSLSVGLWALAEASGSAQAPPSAEKALLQAFRAFQRERRPVRGARAPSWWEVARWEMSRWVLAVGAAVVLVVLVLGARSWERQKLVLQGQRGQSSVASASNGHAADKHAVTRVATPPKEEQVATNEGEDHRSTHAAPVVRKVGAKQSRELAADFLPLGGVLDPLDFEQAEVVRVSLPGSALADLGLPLNEDAEATTITAEVLIAEDGTARAIRFPR
ncbi:MAG: hypothetical protein ACLQOO_28780 [Terriglobia bacterium]